MRWISSLKTNSASIFLVISIKKNFIYITKFIAFYAYKLQNITFLLICNQNTSSIDNLFYMHFSKNWIFLMDKLQIQRIWKMCPLFAVAMFYTCIRQFDARNCSHIFICNRYQMQQRIFHFGTRLINTIKVMRYHFCLLNAGWKWMKGNNNCEMRKFNSIWFYFSVKHWKRMHSAKSPCLFFFSPSNWCSLKWRGALYFANWILTCKRNQNTFDSFQNTHNSIVSSFVSMFNVALHLTDICNEYKWNIHSKSKQM